MQLIESGKAKGIFPSDVIERAKPGGTGAYSDSGGAMDFAKDIAKVWLLSLHPNSVALHMMRLSLGHICLLQLLDEVLTLRLLCTGLVELTPKG